MTATSFYPVVLSTNVPTAVAFYRDVVGFTETFVSDWYVSLQLGSFELAVLAFDHPTIPQGFRVPPAGVILNLEVDDVDAVHDRLVREKRLSPVLSLRDEDFGQRHFIVPAPDGVLLDVIHPIPPSAAFADAYTDSSTHPPTSSELNGTE